jgi:hypothetical protein
MRALHRIWTVATTAPATGARYPRAVIVRAAAVMLIAMVAVPAAIAAMLALEPAR